MLKKFFEQEYVQYMVVGFTSIASIVIIAYLEPMIFALAMGLFFLMIMSLAIGYVIVDSYKMWREDNDKNKSRKKASSSKDAT